MQTKKHPIHINCDLGEGIANDESLMYYIDACNIACGGHAGNQKTIEETIRLAQKHEVQIGIHPSYLDPTNFGRVSLPFAAQSLRATLIEQISLFLNVASTLNAKVNHIKLHGALYNDAASKLEIAHFIIDLFNEIVPDLPVYCPSNSIIAQTERINFIPEAFADRHYTNGGKLVNRQHENALISSEEMAWEQIKTIHTTNQVVSIDGKSVSLEASTFCVHGDAPNALNLLKYIREKRYASSRD